MCAKKMVAMLLDHGSVYHRTKHATHILEELLFLVYNSRNKSVLICFLFIAAFILFIFNAQDLSENTVVYKMMSDDQTFLRTTKNNLKTIFGRPTGRLGYNMRIHHWCVYA